MTYGFPFSNMIPSSSGGGDGNATSIQGIPVDPGPPTSGDILYYDGSDWTYIPYAPAKTTFVTVGTGGNYPSLYAAQTAGYENIILISSVIETQQYTYTTAQTLNVIASGNGRSITFSNVGFVTGSLLGCHFNFKDVSMSFTQTSTQAGFYLAGGSSVNIQGGAIQNTGSSLPLLKRYVGVTNDIIFNTKNTYINIKGATSNIEADIITIEGGTLNGTNTSTTNFINSAKRVEFNPDEITGSFAAGDLINCQRLNINNVQNKTNTLSNELDFTADYLFATNYFDIGSAPATNWQANVRGAINAIEVSGVYRIQPNSFTTISNSVLDSFEDQSAGMGAVLFANNNQWISSGGLFTFHAHTGLVYSFTANYINSDVLVKQNGTQITVLSNTGDFSILDNAANIQVTNLKTSGNIALDGNYCTIQTYTCGSASMSQNAIGSKLIGSTLVTTGITIDSGCENCTVIASTAVDALVNNGLNTQASANIP